MVDPILIERFKAKYALNRQTGCWDWTASTAGKGYGQIKLPGTRRQIYAHHLSYLIHIGEIPKGKHVMHRCDNPKCVNPGHLMVGTSSDNHRDMVSKGRHLYGDRNGNAILTDSDIRAIRMLCAAGDLPQWRIAQMFGIQQMEVSRIHRRVRWAHVRGTPIG